MLSQAQIRGYFSRRAASLKRGAVDATLRGDDAADDADDDDADEDAGEDAGEDDDAHENFKVEELQHILRARELAVSGKEAVLITRLARTSNQKSRQRRRADSAEANCTRTMPHSDVRVAIYNLAKSRSGVICMDPGSFLAGKGLYLTDGERGETFKDPWRPFLLFLEKFVR